jgi:hypothetical protein
MRPVPALHRAGDSLPLCGGIFGHPVRRRGVAQDHAQARDSAELSARSAAPGSAGCLICRQFQTVHIEPANGGKRQTPTICGRRRRSHADTIPPPNLRMAQAPPNARDAGGHGIDPFYEQVPGFGGSGEVFRRGNFEFLSAIPRPQCRQHPS